MGGIRKLGLLSIALGLTCVAGCRHDDSASARVRGKPKAPEYIEPPPLDETTVPMPVLPRKLGVATIPLPGNPWSVEQRQATLEDLAPAWWHNFQADPNGVTPLANSGYFVPMLVDVTDHVPEKIATAVANAQGGWIASLGEFDGHGWTVEQAIDAWGALVDDESILANPDIKLVSPYTIEEGTSEMTKFWRWFDGIKEAGYRLPDAIALDKYSGLPFDVPTDVLQVTQRVRNYHKAFPDYELWVMEFAILGDSPRPSDDVVTEYMTTLSRSLDAQPYLTHYAWWFMGPAHFGGPHGNDFAEANEHLYDDDANATAVGAHWKECGQFL